jgi:FkbM family methyltransferase
MLYNCNDVYIGKSLDAYGEWSEGEVEFFRRLVRPGDVVVDAGANIGVHTLVFSQVVGPGGVVWAFEPQRLVFQLLCGNMALNSVTNAMCYLAALGRQRGAINVPALDYSRPNNFGGISLNAGMPGETVTMTTLDSLKLAACKLVKIDVEGMELEVLQGGMETIQRCKPCLYVENDRPQNSAALTQFIDSLGYHMYWHMPPLYSPQNFFQNPSNVFANIVSGNLICVHSSSNVPLAGLRRTYPGERNPFGG